MFRWIELINRLKSTLYLFFGFLCNLLALRILLWLTEEELLKEQTVYIPPSKRSVQLKEVMGDGSICIHAEQVIE